MSSSPNQPGRGVSTRMIAQALALAAVTATAAMMLGGAGERASEVHQPPLQSPRAAFPDDIIHSYICLRVKGGIAAVQLPDQSWTLRRTPVQLPHDEDGGGADDELAALADDERAINGVFIRNRVQRIDRFMNGEFKRPDLAAKYGLDRSHVVHVGEGVDVRSLVAELEAGFPAFVEHAQLDTIGTLAGIPNDALFPLQWNMHNTGQFVQGSPGLADADIDAPEGWDIHTGSSSTIIAIIDSGVHATHQDLAGKVLPGVDVYGDNGNPPVFGTDTSDLNSGGHGTHVAGIAAARGNDGVGVAGVNWNAKILPIRVVDPSGTSLNQLDLSEGAIWAADNGAHVINMSVQFNISALQAMEDACAYAYDSGALPVAAAGNSGLTAVSWPARYPKCMGVSATNNIDGWWTSSNRGAEIDVSAPGVNVYSLHRTSNTAYQYMTGTSMAAPHVSGLAGLLRSRNAALTVPQIEAIIKDTADDKGTAGWDQNFGWGRINIHSALIAATPPCEGNVNGDGTVDVSDLLAVISAWGACPSPPTACAADIAPWPTGDGVVNVSDLLLVISRWGPCP